jgi:hypothetical protein
VQRSVPTVLTAALQAAGKRKVTDVGELPVDNDPELAVQAVTAAAIPRDYLPSADLSIKAMRELFIIQWRGLRARR